MANIRQVGLVLCVLAALPSTAVGAGSCTPASEQTLTTGSYYEKLVKTGSGELMVELWREANGAAGLQTYRHRCADGSSWAPDLFMSSTPSTSSMSI